MGVISHGFLMASSTPFGPIGSATDYNTTTAAKTFTVSVTVDANANYLAVAYAWGRNSDPGTPTATFNGTSMTRSADTSDNVSLILAGAGVFTLANPATGTHNFVITFTNNVDAFLCRAQPISGAASVQDTQTANGGGSQTDTLSVNLAPTTRAYIFGAMAENRVSGTPSYTPASGVTEKIDTNVSALCAFVGERSPTTGGTYAFGATCSTSKTAALAAVAIG